MENAGNSSVWSTVQKPCHEGLTRIVVYLDRDPLNSRKEHPHILYWGLSFGKGSDALQKLRYLLLAKDIYWFWIKRRTRALEWFLADVLQDEKRLPRLMVRNVISRRRLLIQLWNDSYSSGRQWWLRQRIWERFRANFLQRRGINNNGFRRGLKLPLAESHP